MNAHVKPSLIDQMDAGMDIMRTVRMALMSEWFDPKELLSIAGTMTRGIEALEPVREAINEEHGKS